MPDHHSLRPGDRIRLLAVPAADLVQREREHRERLSDAGWTVDTIERIITQDPLVTIDRVDEYGIPWFEYTLGSDSGVDEEHCIAIMDDESWGYTAEPTT